MPNVMFKRGTQAALNTLIAGSGNRFVDGSFYLTSDTNRLYVAQSATNLVELNKSITVVQSVSQLPTSGVEVGQFYYVAGTNLHNGEQSNNGNILAVVTSCNADGTNPHWTQVNPDTNTDHNDNDHVVAFSITKDTTNSVAGSTLVYNWKIEQEDVDNNALTDLTGQFSIVAADIAALAGASVSVAASAPSSNSTTISTSGAGAGNGSFTITGTGGNVQIGGSANAITISATDTQYEQTVDATNKTITLEEVGGNAIGETTFANGTSITVAVAASNSNKDATITVSHDNVTRSDPAATTSTWAFAGSKTVVTGVTTNAQGHITGVSTETLTLPQETSHAIDDVTAYSDGKIGVSLDGVEVKSGADLYYTVNGTPVYNQGTIDFYTKAQIDAKFDGLDGMTYKGNVPAGGLPSSGVKNGDTYTVPSSGTYGGQSAKEGDLLIASGTETNGVISGTITWNLIPSGNDFNTEYDLTVANNTISLEDNISGSTADTVTIAGGNKLTASTSGTTITIDHDTVSVSGGASANAGNQNLTYGNTVSVVNGVKADAYGHVEAIYTSTLTMPSAPSDTTESLSVTASSGSHGNGTVALDEDGGNNKGTLTFGNGTLTTAVVTQGADSTLGTIVINHNAVTTTHTNNTSTSTVIDPTNGTNVITAVSTDSYGHLSGYTTSKIVLPAAALTELGGSVTTVSTNKVNVGFSLENGGNSYNLTGTDAPEFTLSSTSLTITPTAATSSVPADIAVNIEWGSF